MKQKSFIINSETGIHIKPAQAFVKKAMEFPGCDVNVVKDGREASAKSMIALLGLELSHNSEIIVSVSGGEEDTCLEALEQILSEEGVI